MKLFVFLPFFISSCVAYAGAPIIWGGGADTSKLLTTSLVNKNGTAFALSGSGATTALDNLASVAINSSLLPATTNSIHLGSSSKVWATGYIQEVKNSTGNTVLNAGSYLLRDSGNNVLMDFSSATDTSFYNNFLPASTSTYNLGGTSFYWLNSYLQNIIGANADTLRNSTDDTWEFFSNDDTTTLKVTGFQSKDARLQLCMDQGDDGTDCVFFVADEANNVFSFNTGATGATQLTYFDAVGDWFFGGTTPYISLGDGGAEDTGLKFQTNAETFHISARDSTDTLIIGAGTTPGTTDALRINASGNVTVPGNLSVTGTLTQSNVTPWVEYTPTFVGLGTVTAVDVFSRRNGDSLEISGSFACGTVAAAGATMTIGFNGSSGGVTIDTAKIPAANSAQGITIGNATTGLDYCAITVPANTGTLSFGFSSVSTSCSTAQLGNVVFGTGVTVNLGRIYIPISGW